MAKKESKENSDSSEIVKEQPKKTVEKKPVAKKASKTLKFQGRSVEIVAESISRKNKEWDLLDLKFTGEERIFRIKRKSLDN